MEQNPYIAPTLIWQPLNRDHPRSNKNDQSMPAPEAAPILAAHALLAEPVPAPAPIAAAPQTTGTGKKRGRPVGIKNSGPRRPPGQKAEEKRLARERGEVSKRGRPKGKTDSKERAKAGHGPKYHYGKEYRQKKKATCEAKQNGGEAGGNSPPEGNLDPLTLPFDEQTSSLSSSNGIKNPESSVSSGLQSDNWNPAESAATALWAPELDYSHLVPGSGGVHHSPSNNALAASDPLFSKNIEPTYPSQQHPMGPYPQNEMSVEEELPTSSYFDEAFASLHGTSLGSGLPSW